VSATYRWTTHRSSQYCKKWTLGTCLISLVLAWPGWPDTVWPGSTVVYHDARMKFHFSHFFPKTGHFEHIIRHDIKFFEKKNIFSFQNLGFKSPIWNCAAYACVWSAAKHNKSRCALLKKGRFQVTWNNVVQTCHTLLESLNFSSSFGIQIYFLNHIFVNKKI
jgi:hypothetical protein